jgi:hypothetical protein
VVVSGRQSADRRRCRVVVAKSARQAWLGAGRPKPVRDAPPSERGEDDQKGAADMTVLVVIGAIAVLGLFVLPAVGRSVLELADGLILIIPLVDRVRRVSLRIVTMASVAPTK